jgi:hypothetical protein
MVNLPRRQFLHLAAGAAAVAAIPPFALALDYPTRPVHIIVGFRPRARLSPLRQRMIEDTGAGSAFLPGG